MGHLEPTYLLRMDKLWRTLFWTGRLHICLLDRHIFKVQTEVCFYLLLMMWRLFWIPTLLLPCVYFRNGPAIGTCIFRGKNKCSTFLLLIFTLLTSIRLISEVNVQKRWFINITWKRDDGACFKTLWRIKLTLS